MSSLKRELNEDRLVGIFKRAFAAGANNAGVELGVGDDAAIISHPGKRLVCSVDTSIEGVHFCLEWLSLSQAASRAFTAAVSDLAAMGAEPLAALCNVEFPERASAAQFRQLAGGQAKAAGRYKCPMVGGNLSRGRSWAFTTTVLGTCRGALLRQTARAGDEIWLVGSCGDAAAGLELLRAQVNLKALSGTAARHARACVQKWRSPLAQVETAPRLLGKASALTDVSDGIAAECRHIARASGVRMIIEANLLRDTASSALVGATYALGRELHELQLYGGEDYALLATGEHKRRPAFARVIGEVASGKGAYLREAGRLTRLKRGYEHVALATS